MSETHLWKISGGDPATRHLRLDRRGRHLLGSEHVQDRDTLFLRHCFPVLDGKVLYFNVDEPRIHVELPTIQ